MAADPQDAARYREQFLADPAFKVGIAWQGNPDHDLDHIRSIHPRQFAPLWSVEGVRVVVSLHKGKGREKLSEIGADLPISDLGATFDDFADTAAAIENLDLVVSVDTAVAHLATAMGKPTWILVPIVVDWRWLTGREDSPWYQSVRLFRQETRGEWEPVMDRVARALNELVLETTPSAAGPRAVVRGKRLAI